MTEHRLKTARGAFAALLSGDKRAEYRRDDRDPSYRPGDVLRLCEWSEEDGFTGREILAVVTHCQRGPFVPEGYVMLSIHIDHERRIFELMEELRQRRP